MGQELTLSDLSTRELLNAIRASRSYHRPWFDEDPEDERVYVGHRALKGGDVRSVYATHDEIRAALRLREHVPTKKEGKTLRRLRAQTGMSADQLRVHPRFGQDVVDAQLNRTRKVITAKYARFLSTFMTREAIGIRYKIKG